MLTPILRGSLLTVLLATSSELEKTIDTTTLNHQLPFGRTISFVGMMPYYNSRFRFCQLPTDEVALAARLFRLLVSEGTSGVSPITQKFSSNECNFAVSKD